MNSEQTESTDDLWIEKQGWVIKGANIPQSTHEKLLDENIKIYSHIWEELSEQ